MIMYTILLVACTASNQCETHYLQMLSAPNPTMAYLDAQVTVAEWLAKRPNLVFRSMTYKPGIPA